MTNLNDLNNEFETFVASFNAWVNKMVLGWQAMIKEVQKELDDAMQDVARIRAAAAAALGLPFGFAAKMVSDFVAIIQHDNT